MMHRQWLALLLGLALSACGGVAPEQPASTRLLAATGTTTTADEYDNLRAKWSDQITGGSGIDTADPDIAAQITALTSTAQRYWDTMNTASGRTYLWSDLATWTQSSTNTNTYNRLKAMALAWSTTGSSLQGNASLAAAIISGLDWMNANHYGSGITKYDNWWDWEIGSPQALNDLMVLMYDQLSSTQLNNYLAAIDYYVPDPTLRTGTTIVETGANRLDKAAVVAVRGVLGKSSAKIAQGRDAISQTLLYVSSGDGFYTDDSFIQHTNIAYTGSYGLVQMSDIARLYYLLNGSSWAVTDPNANNVYDWYANGYKPLVYQGAMMDAVRGRAISRYNSSDHDAGRSLAVSLGRLAQGAPAGNAAAIKSTVKHWMQSDTTYSNYFSGMSVYDISNLKAILNDSTVTPDPEQIQTHVFSGMARALHSYAGYSSVVSMFSNRISAFEYGNGENLLGWWTGIGMTNVYNNDLTQYSAGYWPTVDLHRLPGTTTDGSGSGTPKNFGSYLNTYNWAGGSEIDNLHATVGMQFSMTPVTGTTLQGKKSWFLFGDKIIALGAGISNTDGRSVETIVENRKLNAAGDNALTINGLAMPATIGWSATTTSVQWAHLAGSVSGSDIGYWFPSAVNLAGLREARSGSWQQINTGGPSTTVTNNYLSLSLQHGAGPTNASYAYVILPNYTASGMASFAANPTVTILENSTDAQAARDSAAGVTGVNFWNDISKTVSDANGAYLTSNHKASVTVRDTGTELHIGVSDPTQANTGTIALELNRSAWQVISNDPAVTVTQLYPTIKLTVNVNGSLGHSYSVKLAEATTIAVNPIADTYVQDGSYANTNFGTSNTLVVKNDGVGYARQAALKFSLPTVPGTLAGATFAMMPTSVGAANSFTNRVSLLASDSWTETGLTWNTMPAVSSVLGSWTVGAAGQALMLDVTAAFNNAMAGDKLLPLKIDSPTNVGSTGWVNYGSREATAANRPVLYVTYH